MPSVRQVRRRIRSVQNTAKITKAMEMIAASKMRRAQQRTLAGRPYAERMRDLLSHLAAQPTEEDTVHPLLRSREVRAVEVIHITPDRGLAGGLNANLNRRTGQFILEQRVPTKVVAVGRKGRDFMIRYGRDVRAVFTNVSDRPALTDVTPIARVVTEDYLNHVADAVYVVYSQFVTTTVQRPVVQQLIPVKPAELSAQEMVGYIYEPDTLGVLATLLPRYIEMQIYHAVLESIASEQSARMVAMRNATENAKDMIQSLTILMNKVRQETITKELLDIVGGAIALEG
ncbi:MAG: ATP synthase F1 subunit gamma [Chloroflexi bacterium]|nr:ATP synthase F1 subunit gamma [Chloroflexota bacterium]